MANWSHKAGRTAPAGKRHCSIRHAARMHCDVRAQPTRLTRYRVSARLGRRICRHQIAATQLRTLGSKIGIDTNQQRSKVRHGA